MSDGLPLSDVKVLDLTRLVPGPARRSAINLLLAYVVLLTGAAGLLQWDDWPFTSHTSDTGTASHAAPTSPIPMTASSVCDQAPT